METGEVADGGCASCASRRLARKNTERHSFMGTGYQNHATGGQIAY
jgi:hypothetical protein